MANGSRKRGGAAFTEGLAQSLQNLPQLLLMKKQLQQQKEEEEKRRRERGEERRFDLALDRQREAGLAARQREGFGREEHQRFREQGELADKRFLEASTLATPEEQAQLQRTTQEDFTVPSLLRGVAPQQGQRTTPNVEGLTQALGSLLSKRAGEQRQQAEEVELKDISEDVRSQFLAQMRFRGSQEENFNKPTRARIQAIGDIYQSFLASGKGVDEVPIDRSALFRLLGGTKDNIDEMPAEIAQNMLSESMDAVTGKVPEGQEFENALALANQLAQELLDNIPSPEIHAIISALAELEPPEPAPTDVEKDLSDPRARALFQFLNQPTGPGRQMIPPSVALPTGGGA